MFLLLLNNGKVSVRSIIVFFLICIFFLFHGIITHTALLKYLDPLVKVFTAILIISGFKNDYQDIKIHLIKALEIIVTISCINYILIQFPFLFKEVSNDRGYSVKTFLYLFNYLDSAFYHINDMTFMRNQGPYWEPGILQALMNILLYYRLIECNYDILKVKWPIFVLLSTFSTTSYIIFAVILLCKFREIVFVKKNLIKISIMVLVIVSFFPLFIAEINNKFFEQSIGSSALRLYDAYMGLRISKDNFLFGVGYDVDHYYREISHLTVNINGENLTLKRGITNSIVSLFVFFGVPFGFLVIFFLYKQNVFPKKKIFFFCIFLTLLSEPLVISYLIAVFLMSSRRRKS
jgi:hypothetical protein